MIDKRGGTTLGIVVGIVIVLLIISGIFVYYFFGGNGENFNFRELRNPTEGLSDEQALLDFDEGFVEYLLYSIGAGNLRNKPLSKDTPKLEIYIGDVSYMAEVIEGVVNVEVGEFSDEDVIIRAPKMVAIKMIRDRNYIFESFSSGESSVELISEKVELAGKGYLGIYSELTGEEVGE